MTTHCKGDKNSAINYLSKYFDSETLEILKKIKPTNWATLKTEAINFDEHFFWLVDYPLIAEKNILLQNSCLESLIEVDLKRENELKNVVEKLQNQDLKNN